MAEIAAKVLVVGGGPGGYVCAIRAGQLGLDVVLVDGKTCRVETDTGPQVIRAEHVVLATGSMPASLPALPFGGRVISSTEALSLQAIPERLAVIGAGYIGLEL